MAETVAPSEGIPVISADLYSAENLADPLPLHEQIREAGPVVYLEHYNVWVMARYEQVNAALRDWETYSSASGAGMPNFRKEKPWRPPSLLLEADPPAHTRAREVVGAVMGPAALKPLRESFEREANELVDHLLALGSFDAVPELAQAYPLKVFSDAVGLAEGDRENLLPYANMVFNGFGPRNQLLADAMADAEKVQQWISDRCQHAALSPDSFGAHIWEAAEQGKILEEWAPVLVRSLLSAGLDTTINALAAAVYAFALYPEQWNLLREKPALAKGAFEEVIRWESSVQTFFRTTTREVEVSGKRIPAGEKVLLLLGSANRDPRRWQDPDTFDITRNALGHVGFGMGIHRCVGLTVARLEGELLLTALAKRVARIELAGEPKRKLNNTMRAWSSLPVTVSRAPDHRE